MHESVMIFGRAQLTAQYITGKRVIEVGAMNVNGSLRDHVLGFGPSIYIGVDFREGLGVDVVCDASNLVTRFGTEAFDLVVSTEMLEHAQDWRGAVNAMKQTLVPDGWILLTARGPGKPLHGFPHDWHRFTVSDTRRIFADFEIARLEQDSQEPGFLLFARKTAQVPVDLSTIEVAPADEVNAPR
jgi:SAM-dependent methyltransferase